ncbi:heme oxygenase-like protein [Dothidotthia symphoricarpi CBS 119687]|uniref:Heme oxygenase-like protein n=1 Tax=Dothidotthia symphoricarpi CBS 119687 TaxID=1392245 RepID=A0A6A6A184_9PLEO|nr:heme oxygenase-like protein [Dothidotthia symphoricarpi CBS 119687]KAF2124478.1 heme oxygenase-like protein [Dothidotthia symphoricarpi CBS 119687]
MGRHANPDIRRAFQEFQDQDTPSKCNKVKCMHCGYVRAKNTTRQIEHLQECQAYLASPDAQAHVAPHAHGPPVEASIVSQAPSAILSGQQPNPNLQVHRRGPNNKRARDGQLLAPSSPMPMHPHHAPSLTAHLLAICAAPFAHATQQPFLSHAGCGSLAAGPLAQWLVQDGHYARGYIRFVGQLLAKIRLPQTHNSQFHPMYRTMDLLISALNNMRREMQFFEITATKYGLTLGHEAPTPITRALLDLFVSASSSSASLLEGMVVLWGIEHCYRSAWQYASSFSTTLSTPSNDAHIIALHQALIPNWTSPAFSKFVDATRALVDELANITTTRDGKEEMVRCEEIFRQICWLEERFWPEVDGMGEEDDNSHLAPAGLGMSGMDNNPVNNGGSSFNNGPMSGPMTSAINGGDSTPVGDGRNSFTIPNTNGLDGVNQGP